MSQSELSSVKLLPCRGGDCWDADHRLTGHGLHCPTCDQHLTSLLMCAKCGTRPTVLGGPPAPPSDRELWVSRDGRPYGAGEWRMNIKPFFRWYDFWMGFYYDRAARALYICPLPMCGIKIDFSSEQQGRVNENDNS